MANKYGAKKVKLDGHIFDSQRESEYYIKYRQMVENGQLASMELHPKFILQEHFRDSNGKMERAITYKADFLLTYPDGKKMAVEVKGFKTRDYILRRKMFKYKYRDIVDFVEVH